MYSKKTLAVKKSMVNALFEGFGEKNFGNSNNSCQSFYCQLFLEM